jgi:cell wall-associated NlpC family hydrolase
MPTEDKPAAIANDSVFKTSLPDVVVDSPGITSTPADSIPQQIIDTHNVLPDQLLSFARTLIGVPYKYASTDPAQGFDCSGFITHVFNNFKIKVPRSSIDFTNAGIEVPVENAMPGDLILFTGTDSTQRFVGHMGIINQHTADSTTFIHSTSGKAYGVTITPLNTYYRSRFVKVIRIFPNSQQSSL